jgi:preprotein translocase subunit SecG
MGQWITLIIVAHVLIALAIIGLVLLQHGKGADMGSGFGGGASSSLFGATGSANFLSRTTAVLAAIFFLTSLGLAYLASEKPRAAASTVMDSAKPKPPAPPAGDIPKPQALPPAGGDAGSRPSGVPK